MVMSCFELESRFILLYFLIMFPIQLCCCLKKEYCINGTYHLQLHVVVPGIDGHTGCSWEDSIQESKVGQTSVVGTRAVHSNIQNIHHVFTDQRHHQAEERAGK